MLTAGSLVDNVTSYLSNQTQVRTPLARPAQGYYRWFVYKYYNNNVNMRLSVKIPAHKQCLGRKP